MESRLRKLAVDALFPRFCVSCNREGARMCGTCLDHWTPVPAPVSCAFCGSHGSSRTCFSCSQETYLDGLSYFVPYGNALLRELLTSWKYHGDRSVEDVFIKSLRRASLRMQPPAKPYFVTHVPLHVGRKRQRGFDQAEQVALWASEMFGLPDVELVQRTSKTAPQARMSHGKRQVGEMDEVFSCMSDVHVPEHVLLCDDVFTSGTTMDAVARVLKENGAKTVWGFVLAKG
jgi:competence protein ComFC